MTHRSILQVASAGFHFTAPDSNTRKMGFGHGPLPVEVGIFGFEKISLEKQFEPIYKQKKEMSRSIKRQQTANKKDIFPQELAPRENTFNVATPKRLLLCFLEPSAATGSINRTASHFCLRLGTKQVPGFFNWQSTSTF